MRIEEASNIEMLQQYLFVVSEQILQYSYEEIRDFYNEI